MKRKRLICAVLALVMLFSVQSAATAAYPGGNIRSTEFSSALRMPVIRVSVPSYASVYINPFRLPVSIGSGEEQTGQILSSPTYLINRSDAALDVDVTVTGAVNEGSDMTLAPSSTKGSGSTAKRAFIYFELQTANTDDLEAIQWDAAYDASKHIVVSSAGSNTKKNLIRLAPMTLDGEIGEGGYGPFRLTGDAVEYPSTPWNGNDGIKVQIAFTFTPVPFDS